jgi:hypothetical protein
MSDHLVEALVGTKHLRLYLNSATFHAQIEVASRMLPIMVDALAVAAEEEEVRTAAMLKILESAPGPRILVKPQPKIAWAHP